MNEAGQQQHVPSEGYGMKSKHVTGLSILGLLQVGGFLVLIFSLAPLLSGHFWFLDLLSHFRFQYLIISLLLVVVFFICKKYTDLVTAVTCMLLNAVYVFPLYTKSMSTADGNYPSKIKLFHANVLTANTAYDELLAQISQERPDLVVLQEVNQQWIESITAIKSPYVHRIEVPRTDNFGMALYSKMPITAHQIHDWTDLEIPTIEAVLAWQGQSLRVIAAHPPPPVNKHYYQARTSLFEAIAAAITNEPSASIVIGDLNTTQWSTEYPVLETGTGLVNVGSGFMPTWPTNLWPLMIPIDHCLATEHFNVLKVSTGSDFGSDHLPLIVTLSAKP